MQGLVEVEDGDPLKQLSDPGIFRHFDVVEVFEEKDDREWLNWTDVMELAKELDDFVV